MHQQLQRLSTAMAQRRTIHGGERKHEHWQKASAAPEVKRRSTSLEASPSASPAARDAKRSVGSPSVEPSDKAKARALAETKDVAERRRESGSASERAGEYETPGFDSLMREHAIWRERENGPASGESEKCFSRQTAPLPLRRKIMKPTAKKKRRRILAHSQALLAKTAARDHGVREDLQLEGGDVSDAEMLLNSPALL